jgi:hypothetical protein
MTDAQDDMLESPMELFAASLVNAILEGRDQAIA